MVNGLRFMSLCGVVAISACAAAAPTPTPAPAPNQALAAAQSDARSPRFGGRRERFRRRARGHSRQLDASALPTGTRVIHDARYGPGKLETFDIYVVGHPVAAPVIFMVHGGGWRRGDKAARGVVQNKVIHWAPRGIIVISANYPLLPTPPLAQAKALGKALAVAQREASKWGGAGDKFVLMGHSAGAHLVALLGADPSLATAQGARPWLGSVALDSAAYDVGKIMDHRHPRLYDEAFGSNPADWAAASPIQRLDGKIAPLLAVCSSRRRNSCPQARAFAAKAAQSGSRVEVAGEDLRHGEINAELGESSAYTARVDRFLASLDPALARRLR